MKQLTCEMCGGHDLMKQDGCFICQTCGTKYSVEEAKKMMIDGTVDVSGSSVIIDTKADEDNFLINARNSLKMEDWENVNKYYSLLKNANPNNIEAIFFSEYGNARSNFNNSDFCVKENAYSKLIKTLNFVIKKCNDINKEYEIFENIRKVINEKYNYVYKEYEAEKTEKMFIFMRKEIINNYSILLIEKIKNYKYVEKETYNNIIELIVKSGIGLSKYSILWLCFPKEIINECKMLINNQEYEKLNTLLDNGKSIYTSKFFIEKYNNNDYKKYIEEVNELYEKNKYYCAKYMNINKAIQVYESLGNYLDSKELLLKAKYQYGKKLLDANNIRDIKKAIKIFDSLDEYLDSKEIVLKLKNDYKSIENKNTNNQSKNTGGCYIATAVYKSYDCPEVWVLRRFRDYDLAMKWYGRLLVKLYYSIAPIMVKIFGKLYLFNLFWRNILDAMVEDLKRKGYSDTRYYD